MCVCVCVCVCLGVVGSAYPCLLVVCLSQSGPSSSQWRESQYDSGQRGHAPHPCSCHHNCPLPVISWRTAADSRSLHSTHQLRTLWFSIPHLRPSGLAIEPNYYNAYQPQGALNRCSGCGLFLRQCGCTVVVIFEIVSTCLDLDIAVSSVSGQSG